MSVPLCETDLIPDDVLHAAIHSNGSVTAVALAILAERKAERERFVADFEGAADAGIDAAVAAERERCAEIAKDYAVMSWRKLSAYPETDTAGRLLCSGNHSAARHIEASIRGKI